MVAEPLGRATEPMKTSDFRPGSEIRATEGTPEIDRRAV